LDDFDNNTHVIEPEYPFYSHTMRRISTGKHSSILIEIDPFKPREVPEIQFLGSEQFVEPIKRKFLLEISNWNVHLTPRENLVILLGIVFPMKDLMDVESIEEECGVCYSYRLDGSLPDKVCENAKCAKCFHAACLCEWLRALSTTKTSFNTLYGQCPYCSDPITIKEK
jgi:E3 ubiquitin-protein ligase FANCL